MNTQFALQIKRAGYWETRMVMNEFQTFNTEELLWKYVDRVMLEVRKDLLRARPFDDYSDLVKQEMCSD